MTPIQRSPDEVRRILARFTLERVIAGWSVQALADETGTHRSVIDRWEKDRVANPMVSILAALVRPLGLRVDLVHERHMPLLNLNEEEITAMRQVLTITRDGFGPDTRALLDSALIKMATTEETPDA